MLLSFKTGGLLRPMRRSAALLLASFLAPSGASLHAAPASSPASLSERSQAFLEALRSAWEAPAVSAAVAVDGELVFAGAVGQAAAGGPAAAAATRFRIASVSKPITGVLMLRLADEGLLDLDAPVEGYLPHLPETAHGITTRQLLAHASGIRHYERGETAHRTEHYDSPLAALGPVLAEPLLFEPGTEHRYTTYGYTLIQAVAEAVTGTDFEAALDAYVLGPAGMEHTSLDRSGEEASRATGFQRGASGIEPVAPDDVSFKYAGGGMVSTPSDLVRLCAAMDRGAVLEPASREALLVPAFEHLDPEQSLGFAVRREITSGLLRLWHPGRGNGFEAYLLCYPEERVAAAVITNQDWTDPWDEVGRATETLARLHLPAIYLYRTPPQVLVAHLEDLVDGGELEEAASAYARYREEIGGMWGAGLQVHRLAERLTREGRLDAAAALFAANTEAFPESWHTQLALAESRFRIGDLDGAAQTLEAARPLVPGPDVVEPLEQRLADLREPPVARASGEYRLVLEETGLADRLSLDLRLTGEEGTLEGEARSPGFGELPVIRARAGGSRVWVALDTPHGLLELDLLRTGGAIEGRWQVGFESGPLGGTGPGTTPPAETNAPGNPDEMNRRPFFRAGLAAGVGLLGAPRGLRPQGSVMRT